MILYRYTSSPPQYTHVILWETFAFYMGYIMTHSVEALLHKISDGIIGIFYWLNPSGYYGRGVDSASNRNE
jgi:hypothetical protein